MWKKSSNDHEDNDFIINNKFLQQYSFLENLDDANDDANSNWNSLSNHTTHNASDYLNTDTNNNDTLLDYNLTNARVLIDSIV